MALRQLPDTPHKQTVRVPFAISELRAEKRADMDSLVLEGHASVFGYEYDVAGGPPWGWLERIEKGSFDKTLADDPDVVFLLNHEGMPLARTKSGTLELSTDKTGLATAATLDLANPVSRSLASAIERGDIDEMSFAFRTTAQEWRAHDDWEDDPESLRIITEVNIHRGDVSAVTFGASDATDIDIVRSLEALSVEDLAEARAVIERLTQKQNPGGTPEEDKRDGMSALTLELLRIT